MSSALSELPSPPPSKSKWWKPFTKPIPLFDPFQSSQSPPHHHQHHHSHQHHARTHSASPDTTDSSTSAHLTVFGARLEDSLQIASVAISMIGADNKAYIYGFIPVVVAKCGLYLKESGTGVEGVFRISGSTKRMKQLQNIFDDPPFYGKDLDWAHPNLNYPSLATPQDRSPSQDRAQSLQPYFSVHDAANVLRRYLMCLPEPLIPRTMYDDFRQVLVRHATDKSKQVRLFKSLISTLPQSTQYLLLYLLDLLAVFANRSDVNLMTAQNLAVIFQPALCPVNPSNAKLNKIIYHHQQPKQPNDLPGVSIQQQSLQEQESIMKEAKQAQAVLEFLILHQNYFVLGLRPQIKNTPPALETSEPQLAPHARSKDDCLSEDERAANPTSPRSSPSIPHRRRSKPGSHPSEQADVDPFTARSPEGIKRSKTLPSNHLSLSSKSDQWNQVGTPVAAPDHEITFEEPRAQTEEPPKTTEQVNP